MFSIYLTKPSADLVKAFGGPYESLEHKGHGLHLLQISKTHAAALHERVKTIADGEESSDRVVAFKTLKTQLDQVCETQTDWTDVLGMPGRTYIAGFGWRVEFIKGEGARPDTTAVHDYDNYNMVSVAGDFRSQFKEAALLGIDGVRQCCFSLFHPELKQKAPEEILSRAR